mgnify:CR=1 FL=1
MSIFGFGKKKEEQKQPCCCGGSCTPEVMQAAEAEKKESGIKILGGGCAKCNALEAATVDALRELGMALFSIWRIRSRVTPKICPTSSSV